MRDDELCGVSDCQLEADSDEDEPISVTVLDTQTGETRTDDNWDFLANPIHL